jgi:hypothetical protein
MRVRDNTYFITVTLQSIIRFILLLVDVPISYSINCNTEA